MTQQASFESSGPGGSLHWKERTDGVWHASAMGHHFEVIPNAAHSHGYRVWLISAQHEPRLLGRSGTLGGAFGLARDFLDKKEEKAAEPGALGAKEEPIESLRSTVVSSKKTFDGILVHLHQDGSISDRQSFVRGGRLPEEIMWRVWNDVPSYEYSELPGLIRYAKSAGPKYGRLGVAPYKQWRETSLEAKETFSTVERNPAQFDAGKKLGPANTPRLIYEIVQVQLSKENQEVFLVIPLDLHGECLSPPVEIARGQRDRVTIDPADVMRPVITTNARGFVLVHNHPSGHCKPSDADRKVTKSIHKAVAPYAPVAMLDHVVVGRHEFYSITEDKLYRVPKKER